MSTLSPDQFLLLRTLESQLCRVSPGVSVRLHASLSVSCLNGEGTEFYAGGLLCTVPHAYALTIIDAHTTEFTSLHPSACNQPSLTPPYWILSPFTFSASHAIGAQKHTKTCYLAKRKGSKPSHVFFSILHPTPGSCPCLVYSTRPLRSF